MHRRNPAYGAEARASMELSMRWAVRGITSMTEGKNIAGTLSAACRAASIALRLAARWAAREESALPASRGDGLAVGRSQAEA